MDEAVDLGQLAGMAKMDPDQMARSLTGFDEIAIRKTFGVSMEQLEGTIPSRALLFVQLRRDGAKDFEAYKTCMEITAGDMEERFSEPEVVEGKAPTTDSPESSLTS